MRMRKKPNLAIRMERCAGMLVSDPAAMRGRWRELFPAAREVRLEIGCGKGPPRWRSAIPTCCTSPWSGCPTP